MQEIEAKCIDIILEVWQKGNEEDKKAAEEAVKKHLPLLEYFKKFANFQELSQERVLSKAVERQYSQKFPQALHCLELVGIG